VHLPLLASSYQSQLGSALVHDLAAENHPLKLINGVLLVINPELWYEMVFFEEHMNCFAF
jgi:hypothetical protein